MRSVLVVVVGLVACTEYNLGGKDDGTDDPPVDSDAGQGLCAFIATPAPTDRLAGCGDYDIGGFTPRVEWHGAPNKSSLALPTVADLDGDELPEILVNILPGLPVGFPEGELWALHGTGSGVLWKIQDAALAMGASPTVVDLDGDGSPEILAVRALGSQNPLSPVSSSGYAVVAWNASGEELWQSERFNRNNVDYAGAPAVADMDGDGSPEIVVGRVILRSDGTTRGVGQHGRGSWGTVGPIGEGSASAIADLDLDGVAEVIVGDALYTPDGATKFHRANLPDGMVAVANLDEDPEGEWLSVTGGNLRALDTDGSLMWGPMTLWCEVAGCDDEDTTATPPPQTIEANILSVPAIADLDNDGYPEIVVAGGSQIIAFEHDGSVAWRQDDVQDVSGATGASIFDFDANGELEVVYIDETSVHAYEGSTGREVFRSDEHGSNTLFDYPVIADVDNDGSAEIVVAHAFFGKAITVYGSADGNWSPVRPFWNQHAYHVDNIDEDLTVPSTPPTPFATHNTWHAARPLDPDLDGKLDLQVQVASTCELECDAGRFFVEVQPVNRAVAREAAPGVSISVYAVVGAQRTLIDTRRTVEPVAAGQIGAAIVLEVPVALVESADALEIVVDDVGTGDGRRAECIESDNTVRLEGPFCAS